MTLATLIQDAKDNLNAVAVLFTFGGFVGAVFGMQLLDEGHRVRTRGFAAIAICLILMLLVVAQLAVMCSVARKSITNSGSFQPWLFLHDAYFVALVAFAVFLVVLLAKACRYTLRATH